MFFDYLLQIILHLILLFNANGQRVDVENTQPDREEIFCKCMEYWECFTSGGQLYSYCAFSNEVCCITNQTINTETLKPIQKSKTAVCGKKEFDSGIQEFAEPGEWAWHTAILVAKQDLYICGGSLIDEHWVLTAAHCVDDFGKTSHLLKVRIGEYDVSSVNEPEKHEEYGVSQIFIHSNFNNKTLVNDIALLKLSETVRKKPNINIVCLPNNNQFTEDILLKSQCFITGWGKQSERGDHSLLLKEVNVPLWNFTKCEQTLRIHFGPNYHLSKTSICGGDVGHDACDGDGGGGLFCEQNNLWYQIGIISFGIGCGRKNSPGVYTDVKSYLDWIHGIASEKREIT